jgi:hypothetical protein
MAEHIPLDHSRNRSTILNMNVFALSLMALFRVYSISLLATTFQLCQISEYQHRAYMSVYRISTSLQESLFPVHQSEVRTKAGVSVELVLSSTQKPNFASLARPTGHV